VIAATQRADATWAGSIPKTWESEKAYGLGTTAKLSVRLYLRVSGSELFCLFCRESQKVGRCLFRRLRARDAR
jgi:hypothetical protein